MITPTDYNLIAFKAISTFTAQLNEMFGSDKQNHSLKLYERLISKTSISHEKIIKKHIDIFREFCIINRDALMAKDIKKILNYKVEYSPKVYIDFNNIFKKADKETTEVIWKHLLTISALLDPAGNAKEILKNSKDNNEADFLTDIINKVESHVSPDSNPMEAVSSIMSSGVFTDLISGMNSGIQNGSLDLGKLMGTVQKMCTTLGGNNSESKGDGSANNGMDMIANLMSSMNTGNATNSGAPDMTQLASMLGPMLSTLNKGPVVADSSSTIEVEVEDSTNVD
jgi:hypothetical protein